MVDACVVVMLLAWRSGEVRLSQTMLSSDLSFLKSATASEVARIS